MKITPTLMRWLAIVWTIIMLIGCLAPHAELPNGLIELNDKFQHVVIFVLFAVLWQLAGIRPRNVAIVGVLFGAFIELLQYLLPINRTGDLIDLAADSLGVGIGVLVALIPGIRNLVVKSKESISQ